VTAQLPVPTDPPGRRGRGTLRGRLVWAFVGVAILTALVIGVTTSSLLGLVVERNAVVQLQEQADAIAGSNAEIVRPNRASNQLCQTRRVLRASGSELYVVRPDGRVTVPQCTVTPDPITPIPDAGVGGALADAATTSGVWRGYAYAGARLTEPSGTGRAADRAAARQVLGVLLIRPVRVGADLAGGVASRA
jgi:hypothetical protein